MEIICEFCLLIYLSRDSEQYNNLKSDFYSHLKGYIGEKKLDYYLDFLPDIGVYVIHGLRLIGPNYAFQIDTLILTPYFCLVTEIKNLAGTLFFDKYSKQCFQTHNNVRKGINNPRAQASRQADQLRKKLQLYGIYQLPIEYCAIVCSPTTKIETNPGNERLFESVFHMEHIIEKVQALLQKYKSKALTEKKLEKIGLQLVSEHSPFKPNLINKHNINRDDHLKSGVQCPKCLCPVVRVKGHWFCTACKTASKCAHEIGILHYLLNLNPTITNQEWRDFLGIYDRHLSLRTFKSLNFIERQATNQNKYSLTSDWQTKIDLETLILDSDF